MPFGWAQPQPLDPFGYTCGHCGKVVGPNRRWPTSNFPHVKIYLCSFCDRPTFFEGERQVPGVAYGNDVEHLPAGVKELYREARNCFSVGSFTSSVLACRKLLMHIGVGQGAKEGQNFIAYVEYLAKSGFVPPHGKGWVDHIRKKGNEANHEIVLMAKNDAEELISFVEMLLKFIYEFPAKIPPTTP